MQDFLHALDAEFARDPAGPGVAALLASFAADSTAWRPYVHFCKGPYARNLVHGCERYELMVICWNAGRASPVHDHAGQRCWMAALEGEVQETLFDLPTAEGGPLVAREPRLLKRGDVAFITDEIALHGISTPGKDPAISLHLYAKPILACNLYDPATGAIEERKMSYHSIQGELQAT